MLISIDGRLSTLSRIRGALERTVACHGNGMPQQGEGDSLARPNYRQCALNPATFTAGLRSIRRSII